jgi:pilus assembly protein Flp/PilA
MEKFKNMCRQFIKDEDGATMIEYALLAALIALVVAAALVTLQNALSNSFNRASNCLDDASANGTAC